MKSQALDAVSLQPKVGTADPTSVRMTKGKAALRFEAMLVERTADPSTSVGMTKGRLVPDFADLDNGRDYPRR
jgi:hypothetical protein